jgi:hypothetical protein
MTFRKPEFNPVWFAKLLEDHKTGDVSSARDVADYLRPYMGGSNGTNGQSAQTAVIGGQEEGGNIRRAAVPLQVAGRSGVSETTLSVASGCPWDLWESGPDVAVKANPDEATTVGSIVSTDMGRMAYLAKPTSSTVAERRVPVGVVHERPRANRQLAESADPRANAREARYRHLGT